ncbi:hypothetical protein CVT26_000265 [Gymnopilus dilepis]|uniref:Nephrocystin 3-like N-terminal domain-containing protein n=1 Tax=Gymnopilus dilepis TaxID=231916 RepID=A0A409WE14_9AGAR|nr:hypothetical protein CVT26_000265 [Gymnopilus dilepis]
MLEGELNGEDTSSNQECLDGIQTLKANIPNNALRASVTDAAPNLSPVLSSGALSEISSWVEDSRSCATPILYVTGDAGSGKSFLSQATSDLCCTLGRLGGCFFFDRATSGRDGASRLFPTLAHQFASNIPILRDSINQAISEDDVFNTISLDDQFHSLIVGPVQSRLAKGSTPWIVIIDALDECDEDVSRSTILKCIADAVTTFALPLRVIVTSRPDPQLEGYLGSENLRGITRYISLHTPQAETRTSTIIYPSRQLRKTLSDSSQRHRLEGIRPKYLAGFPQIVTLRQTTGKASSYSRSLLLAGHGFPIWNPSGDLARPPAYLKRGISIGDVGVLDSDGVFEFHFNIYLPPDDPTHAGTVPPHFQPVEPILQPHEIRYDREYFPPGHVVASRGVATKQYSDDPLHISFSSKEREGAILVLPNGASREDLISTQRLHEYARRNAAHWYQVINGYNHVVHANGSLFIVTGCDKADDWATAAFPYHANDTTKMVDLEYTWQPDHEIPWSGSIGLAVTGFYTPPGVTDASQHGKGKNQCIFLRGMRISLTDAVWREVLPSVDHSSRRYSYILRSSSMLNRCLDSALVFMHLRYSEKELAEKISSGQLVGAKY